MLIIGLSMASMIASDIFFYGVSRRASTGLVFSSSAPSLSRSLCKFAGLLGSFGFIGLLYWLFPEYHADFYNNYYSMLKILLPPVIILAPFYISWIDRHMVAPNDGYWHMGKLVLLRWDEIDAGILTQHLLGWLVKGFFLPLMFSYFCMNLERFLRFDFSTLSSFGSYFDFLENSYYYMEVGFAALGYIITLRITDTHIRSTDPTMLGWFIALMCYQPFWSLFERQYISYDTHYTWGQWLGKDSPVLYVIWGSVILLLVAIYAWSTLSFGNRFSNLTHRGIITNGPYRYTKHPAYISKNMTWWMISLPFIAQASWLENLRHSLLLLMLNGVYWLRAKTEERHLMRDPEYVAYCEWIKAHGIFSTMRTMFQKKFMASAQ